MSNKNDPYNYAKSYRNQKTQSKLKESITPKDPGDEITPNPSG